MDEGTRHLQSLDHFGGIDYRDDAFFRHHCLGGLRVKPKVLHKASQKHNNCAAV